MMAFFLIKTEWQTQKKWVKFIQKYLKIKCVENKVKFNHLKLSSLLKIGTNLLRKDTINRMLKCFLIETMMICRAGTVICGVIFTDEQLLIR